MILSDFKSINFRPQGQLFEFIDFQRETNGLILNTFSPNDAKGHIALLLHGYFGSSRDLQHLSHFLKNHLSIGGGEKKYDHVLIYEYNTLPSIKNIALQMKDDLQFLQNLDQPIDVYAYSMGGLVSRFWIEKLGAGRFTKNLITFGTPHSGISLGKYEKGIQLLQQKIPMAFSLKDMLSTTSEECREDNLFLRHLNESPSEFVDQINYYTIAGNRPNPEIFRYPIIQSLLDSTEKEMDGIVQTTSAHSIFLESKSSSWKQIITQRATLELDHLEIMGFINSHQTPLLEHEKPPFLQLQKWAQEWK